MICQICNKDLRNITNTHLLKHNLTVQEYKEKFNIKTVVDLDLALSRANSSRGKTYEERHGALLAKELKEIRSIKAKHQMTNFEQIQIRRKKCGTYKNPKLRNKRIKIATNKPEVKLKRKLAMRKLFEGGYMTSSFSKPAYNFICNYLEENHILKENCYYLRGPKGREYFTIINGNYFFYDLVTFTNNTIDTILEVNGPWHYTKKEVMRDPWSKSTPYKNEKTTKYQSYVKDQLKLKRAKLLAARVLVYWIKEDYLEVVK
jgi:hypothetical protein